MSAKHLYYVRLSHGVANPGFQSFKRNAEELRGVQPGYGGRGESYFISHHMDMETVHLLCTDGIADEDDVSIEEVTQDSLQDEHLAYQDLVENYFLPHGTYPNITG